MCLIQKTIYLHTFSKKYVKMKNFFHMMSNFFVFFKIFTKTSKNNTTVNIYKHSERFTHYILL